jgi:hypothetical protein
MTDDGAFHFLGLFDLPDVEKDVYLFVVRHETAAPGDIAAATGYNVATVQQALASLREQGRLSADAGRAEANLGQTRPRTTLPLSLDATLTVSERLYTDQEISALRTAIPMLQFARARLSMFSDHGPNHAFRVKSFAAQLGSALDLTVAEHHLLRAGAMWHDIGNVVDRERHHLISQETVEKLTAQGKLPYTPKEAQIIGLLCRWHRREYDAHRVDHLRGEQIRTGLLASILRVADAMDLDYRRSDYGERFHEILRFFYDDEWHFWAPMFDVAGIRVRCGSPTRLQIFTKEAGSDDNILIEMLRNDLNATPLDFQIDVLALDRPPAIEGTGGTVLLAFPFAPHSLIMAARNRLQLQRAGYTVECLCYPDTYEAAAWLWRDTLPDIEAKRYARLVVVGDRTGPDVAEHRLSVLRQWREQAVAITLLNRHEATWTGLPALINLGVDVVLGNDWSYYWQDALTTRDVAWGRVAAACTREVVMATGLAAADERVAAGLLAAVFDACATPADDTAGWLALAEPIMERIAADDLRYFGERAESFQHTYANAVVPGSRVGRVIVFDGAPGTMPQASYWPMEQAILQAGRKMERGIHFNAPYAVASWPVSKNAVDLLAITHWREEDAVPIRLHYPGGLAPAPQGDEHTIRARLPKMAASAIVAALVDACNQGT